MKTVYLTLFRYDRGEQLSVYSVSDTLDEEKKNWRDNLINFLGYGPDDVSLLLLCQVTLDDDVIERIKSHDSLSECEETEFLQEYLEPILYTNECRVLDECGGGSFEDVIESYGEIKGLTRRQINELQDKFEEDFEDDWWTNICTVYVDEVYCR